MSKTCQEKRGGLNRCLRVPKAKRVQKCCLLMLQHRLWMYGPFHMRFTYYKGTPLLNCSKHIGHPSFLQHSRPTFRPNVLGKFSRAKATVHCALLQEVIRWNVVNCSWFDKLLLKNMFMITILHFQFVCKPRWFCISCFLTRYRKLAAQGTTGKFNFLFHTKCKLRKTCSCSSSRTADINWVGRASFSK